MKSKADKFNKQQKELAEFAKALSHPARIAIIQLLAEKKEIKTGNISDYLPIARTTVSQHLKILKDAGIILGTIDGLKIHYCLHNQQLMDMQIKLNDFLKNSIKNHNCKC